MGLKSDVKKVKEGMAKMRSGIQELIIASRSKHNDSLENSESVSSTKKTEQESVKGESEENHISRVWLKKVEIPTFEGNDPCGWLNRGGKFFAIPKIKKREMGSDHIFSDMKKSDEKVYDNGSFSESEGAESQLFHGSLSNMIPLPPSQPSEIRDFTDLPLSLGKADTGQHAVATPATNFSSSKYQDRDLQMPEKAGFEPPPSPEPPDMNQNNYEDRGLKRKKQEPSQLFRTWDPVVEM